MDEDKPSPRKISYAKPLNFKMKSSNPWDDSSDITPPKNSYLSKPFNFRPLETQETELYESLCSYNHEGGDKYFQIQEMEYTVRRKFQVYAALTWIYLVATCGALLFLMLGQLKNLRFLNLFPAATMVMLYLADTLLIVGILAGIYARMTEQYGKNKVFIYLLLTTMGILGCDIIYVMVIMVLRGKTSPLVVAFILYQVGVIIINAYFLIKAKRILSYFQDIQRLKDDLMDDQYYKFSDSMMNSKYIL